MSGSQYAVRPLDQSTWPAFAALVEANNGVFGGCWCIGMHPDGGGETAAVNRDRKLTRVRDGSAHAALVLEGDECVGWCQFGAPDEVPRIKNRVAYEKELTALPDWRIACCFVGRGALHLRATGLHARPQGGQAPVGRLEAGRPLVAAPRA